MPNITGSITDQLEVQTANGRIEVKPYGTDIRVEGPDVRVGVLTWPLNALPEPLVLDAGAYTVTLTATARKPGSSNPEFTTKVAHFDLQADETWGAIFEGLAQQPPLTPGLVTEAQAAADEAEMWAGQGEALQDAAVSTLLTTPGTATEGAATATFRREVSALAPQFGAVGDGVADDTAALAAALAAGDSVFVPEGASLRVGNVEVAGGKRLHGPGVVVRASAAESALHLTGAGAAIDGLTFEAGASSGQPESDIKLGDGASNISISDCWFKSGHYSAISAAVESGIPGGAPYTTRVSGVLISNNRFTGNYARPIFMHSVDNLTIADNLIRDCRFDAIRTRENGGFVLITGNQFIDIGDPAWPDGQTRDAVDTYYSGANLTISNNVVRTTACVGFDVKGYAPDGTGTNRVLITGNQITGCRYSGIKIFGDGDYDGAGGFGVIHGVVISNNVVQGCNQNNAAGAGSVADAGVLLDGLFAYVHVVNNHIFANYGRGIYAHNNAAGKVIGRDLLVAQNSVVNNGSSGMAAAGIHVGGIDYARIEQNIVRNDSTLANAGAQSIGIYVHHAENGYTATPRSMSIVGNVVRDHPTIQIQADPNNNRATGIGTFRDNLTTAVYRASWQDSRLTTYGIGAPSAAEGAFVRGDRVFNVSPSVTGTAGSQYVVTGWLCTASGSPGTWVEMRATTGT